MTSGIGVRRWVLAIVLTLTPFTLTSLPLVWLSSQQGIEWTYSLFGKDHPLNFGGNPAEVLSHLLNWILMTGCTAGLCSTLIATSLLKADADRSPPFAFLPAVLYGIAALGLLGWTGCLDSRHGEGAVVISFMLFFGPCTFLSAIAALRLLASRASLRVRILCVTAVLVMSGAFQWVYEHSGTGGPNILVFPLLFCQVGDWWFVGRRLSRKCPQWVE